MNYHNTKLAVETRQQQVQKEMKQIRLAEQAAQAHEPNRSWPRFRNPLAGLVQQPEIEPPVQRRKVARSTS